MFLPVKGPYATLRVVVLHGGIYLMKIDDGLNTNRKSDIKNCEYT